MSEKPRFTIRTRTVQTRTSSGLHCGPEVQVVEGRKIVGRFDLVEQAERWIAERPAP